MAQITKDLCESILRANGKDAKGKHYPLTVWEQTQLASAWLRSHGHSTVIEEQLGQQVASLLGENVVPLGRKEK